MILRILLIALMSHCLSASIVIVPDEFRINLSKVYWYTKNISGVSIWKKGESGDDVFPSRIGSIGTTKITFMKKFYDVTSFEKTPDGAMIKVKGATMTIRVLENGIREIDWDPSNEPKFTFRIYR